MHRAFRPPLRIALLAVAASVAVSIGGCGERRPSDGGAGDGAQRDRPGRLGTGGRRSRQATGSTEKAKALPFPPVLHSPLRSPPPREPVWPPVPIRASRRAAANRRRRRRCRASQATARSRGL